MLGESHLGRNLTQMGTGVALPIRAQNQYGPEHLAPRTAGMEGTWSGPWSLGSRNFWTWFSKVKQWGETGGQTSHLEKKQIKKCWSFVTVSVPSSAQAKWGTICTGQHAGLQPSHFPAFTSKPGSTEHLCLCPSTLHFVPSPWLSCLP